MPPKAVSVPQNPWNIEQSGSATYQITREIEEIDHNKLKDHLDANRMYLSPTKIQQLWTWITNMNNTTNTKNCVRFKTHQELFSVLRLDGQNANRGWDWNQVLQICPMPAFTSQTTLQIMRVNMHQAMTQWQASPDRQALQYLFDPARFHVRGLHKIYCYGLASIERREANGLDAYLRHLFAHELAILLCKCCNQQKATLGGTARIKIYFWNQMYTPNDRELIRNMVGYNSGEVIIIFTDDDALSVLRETDSKTVALSVKPNFPYRQVLANITHETGRGVGLAIMLPPEKNQAPDLSSPAVGLMLDKLKMNGTPLLDRNDSAFGLLNYYDSAIRE